MVKSGRSELEARSFAFASLVLGNLMLIIVNLSWSQSIHKIILSANKTLLAVIIVTLSCLFAVLYIPFFTGLFHLTPLHINDFAIIVLAIFVGLAWFEVLKLSKNKLESIS
jgi:Ca2+-transporting ATPase